MIDLDDDDAEPRPRDPLSQEVKITSGICLSKHEAFDACELLARGERALLRAGKPAEAAEVADLFETIESRLMVR